jgi:cytochrome c oxidase subunit III
MTVHAEHFQDARQEADAARLAVWLVVVSELLLFAGLFALYAATRQATPAAFREGVKHMAVGLGTANTFVLLTSSLSAALALASLHAGRRGLSLGLVGFTFVLGGVFLAVKSVEYSGHLAEGMGPAMAARADLPRATALFVTLYWLMTGLHALHVVAGMGAFAWAALRIMRGTIGPTRAHPLELVTVYWHFVDLVWIFLWPAFYLTGGGK